MELKAVLLNCTLKKSPAPSHTQGLIDHVIGHLHDLGVSTEVIRPVDYNMPFGVDSDLGDGDEWPLIREKILAADILIMGMRSGSACAAASARWSSSASTAPTA
jgi:multimeric flavodoxin WrbA